MEPTTEKATARYAQRRPSILAQDFGAGRTQHLKELSDRAPPERLLFGTDGGGCFQNLTAWYVAKIRACVSSRRLLEMIFHENAERLLEVAREGAREK